MGQESRVGIRDVEVQFIQRSTKPEIDTFLSDGSLMSFETGRLERQVRWLMSSVCCCNNDQHLAQSRSITISISRFHPPTSISTHSVHRPSDSLLPLVSSSSSLGPHTKPLISYPLGFLSYSVYLWLRLTTSAFLLDKPSLDPTNDHSNLLS